MAKLYTRESLDELIKLYNKALKIQESTKMTDEDKFDIIFGEEISEKIMPELDFIDPDGTEEEDINAFMSSFERYVDLQEEILAELNGEEQEEK